MIALTRGNLLAAKVDALVNTVNTEGVMGKGIALQFRRAFPSMFDRYIDACKAGEVRLGQMHVVEVERIGGEPRWIINFPTKKHWRSKSRLEDIETGLKDLIAVVKRLGIRSIALPPLGCGYGGLEWNDVYPLIADACQAIPDVQVLVYPPDRTPDAKDMPTHTEPPKMTIGRAALLVLLQRYKTALLDPFVSLLEAHKLMYFLQEAGQPLRLQYDAGTYGPYSKNLRQVLIKLEGHWLSGYGDGKDKPTTPLEVLGDAEAEAEKFLDSHPEVTERMERVAVLIEGYEDSYGLELLSSVHWVMCKVPGARDSSDVAIDAVQQWNPRKRKLLKPEHLRTAWQHLRNKHWHTDSRSAIQYA